MDRKKIIDRIRALRAKTTENGCTEEEAAAAAEMVARLLERYNLDLKETDLRQSEFDRRRETFGDDLGRVIHRIASAIADMMDIRYWAGRPGEAASITFFGFTHEVAIASYLLDICHNAMETQSGRVDAENRLLRPNVRRRRVTAFLDGMADRLSRRIRDLKPPAPTGRGLIVLKGELVDAEMERLGLKTRSNRARSSYRDEEGYARGRRAADRVQLEKGITSGSPDRRIPSG